MALTTAPSCLPDEGVTCHEIATDTGPIHIHETGLGEPLVLLHGFPEDGLIWRPMLAALGGKYRAVLPDLPGFSLSAGASTEHPEIATRTLVAGLDALGIDRFHLIAHDIGGMLAWSAAAQLQDRLRSLVLVAAPHPAPFIRRIWQDAPEARREYVDILVGGGSLDERFAPAGLVQFIAPPSPAEEQRLVAAMARGDWSMIRRYYAWLTVGEWLDAWDALAQPSCPILALAGRDDPFVPWQASAAITTLGLPDVTHEIVENAGHFLHVSHCEWLASRLSDWLRGAGPELDRKDGE